MSQVPTTPSKKNIINTIRAKCLTLKSASCFQRVYETDDEYWKAHVQLREGLQEIDDLQKQLAEQESSSFDWTSVKLLDKEPIRKAFEKWSQKRRVEKSAIKIVYDEEKEFTIRAARPVEKTKFLLSIPHQAVLSADRAFLVDDIKNAVTAEDMSDVEADIGLALYICLERVNEASEWRPFLDVLPQEPDVAIFYNFEEFESLKPSPAVFRAIRDYREVARSYLNFLIEVIHSYEFRMKKPKQQRSLRKPVFSNELLTPSNFTFKLYSWASAVMLTQFYLLPSRLFFDDEGKRKLVPGVIPYLNMAERYNDTYRVFPSVIIEENDVTNVVALHDYVLDEVVEVAYGRNTSYECLMYDGYLPPYDVEKEFVHLKMDFPKDIPYYSERAALMEKDRPDWNETVNDFRFLISGKEPYMEPIFLTFARVAVVDRPDRDGTMFLETLDNNIKAFEFIVAEFQKIVDSYGNLEEDKDMSRRQKLILNLKRRELTIMKTALNYCSLELQNMRKEKT